MPTVHVTPHSNNTLSTVSKVDVYFQLMMEELEDNNLVFLLFTKDIRCFVNLSPQRDHPCFQPTMLECVPQLPPSRDTFPLGEQLVLCN